MAHHKWPLAPDGDVGTGASVLCPGCPKKGHGDITDGEWYRTGSSPMALGTAHQGSPPWLRAARQLVSMFPYIAAAVLYL